MKRGPAEHWICLDCRKQFRKPSRFDGIAPAHRDVPKVVPDYPCPGCKSSMRDVGKSFKAPRRTDKRAWQAVRLLLEPYRLSATSRQYK